MPESRLIISARVGDAVRSAWAALTSSSTVATVFSNAPSDAERMRYLAAVAADRAALRRVGAVPRYLDCESGQIGTSPFRPHLRWALQTLARDCGELWFPADLDGTPESAIVHEVATSLRGSFRRVVYSSGPAAVATEIALTAAQLDAKRAALAKFGESPHDHLDHEYFSELPRHRGRAVGRTGRFLTVLTRTRGDRPATLRTALSSLAAQSNRDFELILLCHNTSEMAVGDAVAELPEWLRGRTRALVVVGGKRSTPLNAGVRAARSRYFTVLDDDDEALPDWVATFAELENDAPGEVLRTAVKRVFLDRAHPDFVFPFEFDAADHLTSQRSPFCGLAFPVEGESTGRLQFDEELDVLEDWDYLLRAAARFGVASCPLVTSHYYQWPEQSASATEHAREVWERTEETIRGRYAIERE